MRNHYFLRSLSTIVLFYSIFFSLIYSNDNKKENIDKIRVSSPSSNIEVVLSFNKELSYTVLLNGKTENTIL